MELNALSVKTVRKWSSAPLSGTNGIAFAEFGRMQHDAPINIKPTNFFIVLEDELNDYSYIHGITHLSHNVSYHRP